MKKISELVLIIGRLQESSETHQRQVTNLFVKNDIITSHLTDMKIELIANTAIVTSLLKAHDKSIKTLQSDITMLKRFRQRVWVGVAGIGGGGGAIGATMTKFFDMFGKN